MRFKVGKAILIDKDRYGRPVPVTNEVRKEKVNDLVQANRRINQKHVPLKLQNSKERVQYPLSEHGYRKIIA